MEAGKALRSHRAATALNPQLVRVATQQLSCSLSLQDCQLDQDMWAWLSSLQLRGLRLEKLGIEQLARSLPQAAGARFAALVQLSVQVQHDSAQHLSGEGAPAAC